MTVPPSDGRLPQYAPPGQYGPHSPPQPDGYGVPPSYPPAYPPGVFVPMQVPDHRGGRTGLWIAFALAMTVGLAGAAVWFMRATSHDGSPAAQPGTSRSASSTAVPAHVRYRSTEGHFVARFSQRPVTRVLPTRFGAESARIVLASDPAAHLVVESALLRRPLPARAVPIALHAALRGITVTGTLSLRHDADTRFRGHRAVAGRLSGRGATLSVLAVAYSTRRMYLIVAPSGEAFHALKASFTMTA